MAETLTPDICVIGAGTAGLCAAAQRRSACGRADRGRRMGGDCLNTGCVPSKALLAAAQPPRHRRGRLRHQRPAGRSISPRSRPCQGVIEAIAPNDSEERFAGLGVQVIRARAASRPAGRGGRRSAHIGPAASSLRPDRGRPFRRCPDLRVPYLTNENVFALDRLPDHLLVIGGGPIGFELAQAFRRLGAKVTMVEMARLLAQGRPRAASPCCAAP